MHRQSAGQTQQARQRAVKMNGKAGPAIGFAAAALFRRDRHQDDLLHQGPQRFLRLLHPVVLRQAPDQLADPRAIGGRHAGMDPDRIRGGRGRKLALQVLAPRVELDHPVLDLFGRHPGDDRIHQLLVIGADLLEFPLQFDAARFPGCLQAVALGGIFLAEDPHGFLVHQVMIEGVEHPPFQIALFDDSHIGAGSGTLLAGRRAAEAILRHFGKPAAAAAAGHQAREQELRAPPVPDRHIGVLRLHRALARLHLIPQRLVDDPQVWDVDGGDPIFRVQPRVPLAGVRILAEMQPVPDQTADIKLVVQDAGAALAVAENGRGAPPAAARAGDALDVQGLGDLAGGGALGVVAKDPPHDFRLCPVDRAVAVLGFAVHRDPGQHVIAVSIAAGELACPDPALLAAMGLDADVAQQDLVHRPLHADQHLGDLALGERVDPDAQMLHPLVELRDIGELPRQPVHGLGQNDIELARPCLALQGLACREGRPRRADH
nr:hypothetical protein [Paracoccus mutanolyticus]